MLATPLIHYSRCREIAVEQHPARLGLIAENAIALDL
jgi:hypothetical protein